MSSTTIGQYEITKSLMPTLGNLNQLQDVTAEVQRFDPVITLVTSLVQPEQIFLNTNTFRHDYTTRKNSMPTDKNFSERGVTIDARPVTATHNLSVPSYGLIAQVRPNDVTRRRRRGTNGELMTFADVVADEKLAVKRAWDYFSERSLVHSIVNGTNYLPNGTQSAVDFYQEYTGAARPVVNFALSNATVHPERYTEDAKRNILDNLNEGEQVTDFVMLCGKNFFRDARWHPQWIQAHVDRPGYDGQDPLIKRLDNWKASLMTFRGADGVVYLEAGGVIGTGLIPDDEAYLIPLGVNLFTEYFAPAETMSYANSVAESMYMWETQSEFDGTKMFTESNRILVPHNPLLIQKCVRS